ncbi:hypothetical protein MKK75_00880 [Methylobacterium sp. J-030]|uniref:hypothetical protein n=1 Tax=Methylobacterium sp. J-030 TaxID=2836627 RepID=UPI001FBB6879|nr:hypothetical protein [Methylobacterium sp. J-030]MCJ2067369.1 hypothetical protein [Methylobacterium sp. J-030]
MIDYEAIGIARGMSFALRRERIVNDRNIDIANGEIRKANGEIGKANTEIARLRSELAQAKFSLLLEVAHKTGILAQGRALRAELTKLAPDHPYLKPTGLRYDDGSAQIELNLIYDAAFDLKAKEIGLDNSLERRSVAK